MSEALNEYLREKVVQEVDKKEDLIKWAIYRTEESCKKLKDLHKEIWSPATLGYTIPAVMSTLVFIWGTYNEKDPFIAKLGIIVSIAFSLISLLAVVGMIDYFLKRRTGRKAPEKLKEVRDNVFSLAENMKDLFCLLANEKYEFRYEIVRKDNDPLKLKIIVEENTITEGGHVIKEKSKNFTTYVDVRTPGPRHIVGLVKMMSEKANKMFANK